jgi:hypothetical protein
MDKEGLVGWMEDTQVGPDLSMPLLSLVITYKLFNLDAILFHR